MEINEWGTKRWRNTAGQLHRKGGPAVEKVDGDKEWWFNGKLHREDGPAIELVDGDKMWFINGKAHREDGPSVEWSCNKAWYIHGNRHREDGPAFEGVDGNKEWWINGKRTSKKEFEEWKFENLQKRARNIKHAGRR